MDNSVSVMAGHLMGCSFALMVPTEPGATSKLIRTRDGICQQVAVTTDTVIDLFQRLPLIQSVSLEMCKTYEIDKQQTPATPGGGEDDNNGN
jgi:hypothetical protein